MAWRLLTNHMYVLLCVAREPDIRVREVALAVGITERTAQTILRDLVADGFVEVSRIGRRSRYRVIQSARFPHALLSHVQIGEIVNSLNDVLRSPREVAREGSL